MPCTQSTSHPEHHTLSRRLVGEGAEPNESELIARIALNCLMPRHPAAVSRLLKALGSAEQVLQASADQLRAAGTPRPQVADITAFAERPDSEIRQAVSRQVDASLKWLQGTEHVILTPADPAWPPLLSEIYDPPAVLYVRGDPDCLLMPALAMVGSRNTSHQDREVATMLAAQLSRYLCIVSGLALGVDAACHRGALAADGYTCAVLGHGCDLVYPRRNRRLADEVVARSGVLVSSYPLGMEPQANHFPQRNRIVTGLSLGSVVVAAQQASGSMISARLALEQGRLVFAVPGAITDDRHAGCHQLIRDGAALVTAAGDILEELCETGWIRLMPDEDTGESPGLETEAPATGALRERLLSLLSDQPMPMDEIQGHLSAEMHDITTILVELEIGGRIVHLPGGYVLGVDGDNNMG